ncbi:MAG: hypothetical protein QM535_17995 [Limnohabitans sp.]|nr:hypothetical protein [Limnohabitans sp.]
MLFYHTLNCIQYISPVWKEKHHRFLHPETLSEFSHQLEYYFENGVHLDRLPKYQEEIKIDFSETVNQFKSVLDTNGEGEELYRQIAQLLETTPFEQLLLILGQRITSASVTDEKGIPPLKEILLASCQKPFNQEISCARRAWEKHLSRGYTDFWGTMKGNNQEKEALVFQKINYVIENATWWNIFGHYKHGYVYEIRIDNGNGIRWNQEGTKLIGFLEPFLES